MNILLVFATNSGGTQLVAEIIGQILTKGSHVVTTKNVRETNADELGNYDLVIFGSPSWDYQGKEGQPHEDFVPYMEKFAGRTFPDKRFAVFGLGDKSYTEFCGAVDQLEEFVKKLQGKLVIESLRINGFYFDQENNSKLVSDWAQELTSAVSS